MNVDEAIHKLIGGTDIEKAFQMLENPGDVMKALDKTKLVKKQIVDKTGRRTTKWVKPGEVKSEKVKKVKEQTKQTGKKTENPKTAAQHAKDTPTEHLHKYTQRDDKDKHPGVSDAVHKELESRGEKVQSGTKAQEGKEKNTGTKRNTSSSKKSTTKRKPQWYDGLMKKYQLDRLPQGVKQKDVVIDETSPDKTWIMKWKDPKSGRTHFSYSKAFLERNAREKWSRIEKIKPRQVALSRSKALKLMNSDDPKTAEAAAVIFIMSTTGLRPGNKTLHKVTGNRGVSTLSPDNVEIDGETVRFNFVGKSYKENLATVTSKKLSTYLTKLKEEKKGKDFLFDVGREKIVDVFRDDMGFSTFKLKDMRTYVATNLAKDVLYNDPLPPLPLPEKDREIKAAIHKKLKHVFNVVSQQLNNTPAMAKSSYVHPAVIENWIVDLGIKKEEILKGEVEESEKKLVAPSMKDIKARKLYQVEDELPDYDLDDEAGEDNDTYPLPDWWDDKLDNKIEEEFKKAEEVVDYEYTKYMGKSKGKKREDHSWALGLEANPDEEVVVYKVNLPIDKLIKIAGKQDFTTKKDIEDNTIEKAKKVKDRIKGGKADKKTVAQIAAFHKVKVSQIEAELKMGQKIELEHTDSKEKAREIALDHLVELPDYYTRLKRMEKEGEKELEKAGDLLPFNVLVNIGDSPVLVTYYYDQPEIL